MHDVKIAWTSLFFMPASPVIADLFANSEAVPVAHACIGVAGWSLPLALQPRFPANGSHLERYAAVFPSVEINSSFYRPHKPATYARWRDSVPGHFRFSVKLPREITHYRRLANVEEPLSAFLDEAGNLGDRLGCLLVQMPPSAAYDAAIATAFFSGLRERIGEQVDIACEARHRSWFGPEAAHMLASVRAGRVIADPAVGAEAAPVQYRELVYIRLHGSPEIYHSNYDHACLRDLAAKLRHHLGRGRRVWCIFDNTASGCALPNALDTLAGLEEMDAGKALQRGGAGGVPGGGGGGVP
jgi:uncharacterized protein YecE (DUF72 family)